MTVAGAVAGATFVAGIDAWAPALNGLASPPVLAAGIISLAATTGAVGMLVFVAVSARDARPALAGGVTQGVVKSALIIVFAFSFPDWASHSCSYGWSARPRRSCSRSG